MLRGRRYFVEPLSEHVPNKRGHHLHMVYEESEAPHRISRLCGTTTNWADAWRERFRKRHANYVERNDTKRSYESKQRYLETLVVADKKFLEHHKNTDYETYILTIMNMVRTSVFEFLLE